MADIRDIDPEVIAKLHRDTDAAFARAAAMQPDLDAQEWLVDVPDYDHDGLVIERFTITEQQATIDKLRAAFNPQRDDRSVDAGTFTRLSVDGQVWMTDTPAEVRDHRPVDEAMARFAGGSMLIAGLGLGVVLNRAIRTHEMGHIDVVELDARVIDAVGEHFEELADDYGLTLLIHHADVHAWAPPRGGQWDVGWFDIWPTIDDDDMAEVKRLRDRFRRRLGWFGAWAQNERIAMKRRIRSGRWAY